MITKNQRLLFGLNHALASPEIWKIPITIPNRANSPETIRRDAGSMERCISFSTESIIFHPRIEIMNSKAPGKHFVD
jgi:hypothetical protein